MKIKNPLLLAAVFFALSSSAFAAPPKSLGDLNQVERLESFAFGVQSGSLVYFTRISEADGVDLWKTDGTVAGTAFVKNISPTVGGGGLVNFSPATIGGQDGAYFAASTAAAGTELWVTNGTAVGTKIVKDINPGAGSGLQINPFLQTILTINGSSVAFFGADNGVNGRELWSTDGTPAGTNMIQDLNVGAGSSNPETCIIQADH